MMRIDGNSRRGTMKKVCEEKSRIFHPYQVWHWPNYTSANVLTKNWIFLFYQIWPTKTWDINFKELKPSCYRWTSSYGCNPIPFWLVPRPAATPIQCHFWILILVYMVHNHSMLHAKFRPIDFMISPLTSTPIFRWEFHQTLQGRPTLLLRNVPGLSRALQHCGGHFHLVSTSWDCLEQQNSDSIELLPFNIFLVQKCVNLPVDFFSFAGNFFLWFGWAGAISSID